MTLKTRHRDSNQRKEMLIALAGAQHENRKGKGGGDRGERGRGGT